ncbi:SET domain-containing protein 4 [Elsinoe fawcettii]|nr:SET domain-containing protein 4 [Elsinoe fawcettii]
MPLRGRYIVDVCKIDRIIIHRPSPSDQHQSQYLVCWKSNDDAYPPLSWHGLNELNGALHIVQQYIQDHKQQTRYLTPSLDSLAGSKRKRSGNQLLTPESGLSPGSGASPSSAVDNGKKDYPKDDCFNCFLQRKEGRLVAIPCTTDSALNVRKVPTVEMKAQAVATDLKDAEHAIRRRYVARLESLQPPVRFQNNVDRETPSLAFNFIDDYVLREGVTKQDLLLGCQQCKPNMGANRGCEYTKKCDCLEFAAPDMDKLDDEQRAIYQRQIANGEIPSTAGLPKRFPYLNTGARAGCLVDFYLSERHVIYECNDACKCGPNCKNRNVQHGRRVKLEVFKTSNGRGFGLRCLQTLKRGQFIDTYLGEVITDAEADRREAQSGAGKASYLFGLDKFEGDRLGDGEEIKAEDTYVVDGQFMGGPTRFINHSCEPNVQMHTVSYNKFDYFVYDLAFFATEDIPAGEELCFDYMDADDIPKETNGDTQMAEGETQDGKIRVECRCGAERCRRYLWM